MAKKFLFVYPNPFIHLDHDGYPAGACPCDMPEHVGMTTRRLVGAEFDPDGTFLLEKLSQEESRYRDARQQTRFKFDFTAPTMLPVTEYYKDRLRHGEILPADAATAALGGIKFVPAAEALAKSKAEAAAKWIAMMGPGEKPDGIDSLDKDIAAMGAQPAPQPMPRMTETPKTTKEVK
jgi:hypothetical protein